MKQLQDMGASYFILDLRDNLGGLIQAGIEVAKLFLNEGETFWRITKLIVLVKLLLLHFMITVELFLLRRGLLAWFSYFPPFHQIAMKFRLPTGKYVTPNQLDINGNGVEPDYRNFPGSSVTEKPPPEETNQKRKQKNQDLRILLEPSISTTAPDNIPIVNPTKPGTTTPSPTSPSTEPITNPTTPTTTLAEPITTPTTPNTTPATSGGTWCIANQDASPTALQVALDYACGYGGADCSAIQTGASCYDPNTVRDHASYAFNDYYQKHPAPASCVFEGTAQLTNIDPSNGNCHYVATSPTSVTPPASITSPATLPPPTTTTMTPPFTMTPPTFTGPGGDVYGSAEPTGLPSSATSVSFSFLLIFATIGLAWSLVATNKL
ncbi:integumentary mucin C.1-like isoform X2 [Durio zibethinus]|nr:integumentary mucin C.1-like isoform X2 [Durio zibethinus]XP_022715637.1 integumentary mucin C.1-like isoform X2 [Durio zibethinus]